MDLLERYLQAVGQFLPGAKRADTIAELRANLAEQMDARGEELGGPLSDSEAGEVLRAHGRPEVVAARYLPQRSLIGPALFPIYELTLRKGVGYVALVYAIVRGLTVLLGTGGRSGPVGVIVEAVLGLVPTLLYFWGALTIVFAAIEFAHDRYGAAASSKPWDPAKLPPLKKETGQRKPRSRAGRVAELVVHCLWMAFVLALLWHPSLMIGWAMPYLQSLDVRFAPVWHRFFLFVVAVLTLQLASKLLAFWRGGARWVRPLGFGKHVLNIAAFGVMVYAGGYLVPASSATSSATNLERISEVNQAMGIGFRIALLMAVLGLLIDGWRLLRRSRLSGPMVMGEPR